MNRSFFAKNRTRFVLAAMLLAQSLSLLTTLSAQDQYQARVRQIQAKFHAIVDSRAENAQKISNELGALQGTATGLDRLREEIANIGNALPDLEMEATNARKHADALKNQLDRDLETAQSNVAPLLEQLNALCGRLDGVADGNGNCTISCRADDAGCRAKVPYGQQQLDSFRSQIEAIVEPIQSEQKRAEAAETTAASNERDRDEKKSHLADKKRELKAGSDEFNQDFTRIDNEINAAQRKPELKGKAWQDLNNVSHDQKDYDTPNSQWAIPTAAPSIPVPPAVFNSPDYLKANVAATEAVNQATTRANAAQKAFQDAMANHASAQEVQRLEKISADANHAKIWAEYKQKSLLPTNLLSPVAPKPVTQ